MVLMPGFQSTQLATEGALEPFFFLYTDDSIQGNPETCKQSSIMLNYEVKNMYHLVSETHEIMHGLAVIEAVFRIMLLENFMIRHSGHLPSAGTRTYR